MLSELKVCLDKVKVVELKEKKASILTRFNVSSFNEHDNFIILGHETPVERTNNIICVIFMWKLMLYCVD